MNAALINGHGKLRKSEKGAPTSPESADVGYRHPSTMRPPMNAALINGRGKLRKSEMGSHTNVPGANAAGIVFNQNLVDFYKTHHSEDLNDSKDSDVELDEWKQKYLFWKRKYITETI